MVNIRIGENGLEISAKYLGITLFSKGGEAEQKVQKNVQLPEDAPEDVGDVSDAEPLAEQTPTEEGVTETKGETEQETVIVEEKKEQIEEKPIKAEAERSADTKDEPKKKPKKKGGLASLKAKYLKIKPYAPMTWKYFRKLLKAVRISVVGADISVGREDAHEAAIYYGIIQGVIAHIFTLLASIFTLSVKRCDVSCDFLHNKIDGSGELCIKVRPSAVIAIAVCFAVNFLIIRAKTKKQSAPKN